MVISIKSGELENLKRLGSGTYGTVYQKDENIAYKIYHPTIYTRTGMFLENPSLKHSINRLKRLKNRGKKLQFTDVLTDFIYIDGKFGGICIPYYDGVTLDKFMDEKFEVKMDVSRQLVRNGKELNNHHIYPMDYKLNNLMIEHGNVRIIDLDDRFTHVRRIPSIMYKKECASALNDTIRTYFDEYQYTPFGKSVKEKLLRKKWPNTSSYEGIETILDSIEEKNDYLVMDKYSSIEEVLQYLSKDDFRILFVFETNKYDDNYFLNIISQLKNLGIDIYDFLNPKDLSNFLNNNSVNNLVYLQEKPKEKIKLN